MHINRDGYLPDVQVYQDNNVTVISFAVCLKLADSQFNNIQNYSTPFIVLALDQVLYYTNIDYCAICQGVKVNFDIFFGGYPCHIKKKIANNCFIIFYGCLVRSSANTFTLDNNIM